MKYDAGMKRLMTCAEGSMLETGVSSPEKRIDGVIRTRKVTSMAATCVVQNTEIRRPNPMLAVMYSSAARLSTNGSADEPHAEHEDVQAE